MVCVRKPISLAFRGGVRKPEKPDAWIQEGPAGLGLRTKTEFIGFQKRRAQTERPLRPGSEESGLSAGPSKTKKL